jgi:hypothetical protein
MLQGENIKDILQIYLEVPKYVDNQADLFYRRRKRYIEKRKELAKFKKSLQAASITHKNNPYGQGHWAAQVLGDSYLLGYIENIGY